MDTTTLTPAAQAKLDKQNTLLTLFERNILSVYYAASPVDIQAGQQWYANAQAIASQLAATYGLSVLATAGIIAATSPQKDWNGNVALAERLIATYKATGTPAIKQGGYLGLGLRKVDAILTLENPTEEEILPILNGQKIQAFFQNINGNQTGVCVDGHAYNIAFNGLVRKGISVVGKISPLTYDLIAKAYRNAAKLAKISPAAMQATTWTVYRNLDFVKGTK